MVFIWFYSYIYSYKKASSSLKNEVEKNKIPISKYFIGEKELNATEW